MHARPEPSVIHSTFVVERSFPKPPQTVFAAFSDGHKKRRWFAEGENNDLQEFSMDFRVGGAERLRYKLKEGPVAGLILTNIGVFQDIVPNRRIVTASAMSLADKRISASLVTFEFLPTSEGTDLICTNQGTYFEGADGPQLREGGFRALFEKLSNELAKELVS